MRCTGKRLPYLFRSSAATSQTIAPIAKWVAEHVAQEALIIASDYTGGHDVMRVLQGGLRQKRRQDLEGDLTRRSIPSTTAPISPTSGLDGAAHRLCEFFPGPDAARFTKQFSEMGLKAKCKMSGYRHHLRGSDDLPSGGRCGDRRHRHQHVREESLDTPENRKFRADYKAKFGEAPSFYSDYGYVGARGHRRDAQRDPRLQHDKDKLLKASVPASNSPRRAGRSVSTPLPTT